MKVRPLRAATEDTVRAVRELERMCYGWGDDFDGLMQDAVAEIGTNPRMFPRTEDGPEEPENREYYIDRFEYRVIYAIWKDEAVIVAVLHAARRPGVWIPRLAEIDSPEDLP
jgi:plasmid stabilization system protein ParE